MKDFKFKINGTEYSATVEEQDGNMVQVTVNGNTYSVEVEHEAPKASAMARPAAIAAPAPKAAPAAPKAAPKAAAAPAAKPAAGAKTVNAPLPGTITAVKVSTGQAVKKGEVLVVMEAMKMANDITAECDGTVKNIFVQQGASVNVGDALVEIA